MILDDIALKEGDEFLARRYQIALLEDGVNLGTYEIDLSKGNYSANIEPLLNLLREHGRKLLEPSKVLTPPIPPQANGNPVEKVLEPPNGIPDWLGGVVAYCGTCQKPVGPGNRGTHAASHGKKIYEVNWTFGGIPEGVELASCTYCDIPSPHESVNLYHERSCSKRPAAVSKQ